MHQHQLPDPSIEKPDNNLVRRFISANNAIWNTTYYEKVIERKGFQLCMTPELADMLFLNCAQNLEPGATLSDIEMCFSEFDMRPAIYADSNTPVELIEELKRNGYQQVDEESEIWRVLKLDNSILQPREMIDESLRDEMTLRILDLSELLESQMELFERFLQIDAETNDLDEKVIEIIRRKLLNKYESEPEIFILLGQHKGGEVCCAIELGFIDGIGGTLEAGTIESYRGKGLFPWLKLEAANLVKSLGGDYILSSVLTTNQASQRASDKTGFSRLFERRLWVKGD